MKRLREKNINTPELSWDIFNDRWRRLPHYIDWERFEKLGSKYNGGRYLDVGCFNSPYPGELAQKYPDAEIHAIDWSTKVLEQMQWYFEEVKYKAHDITTKLPFHPGYFDYIVCGEVLEHMEDPERLIHNMMRVLKKNGILAISTPDEDDGSCTDEHVWSFDGHDIAKLIHPHGSFEGEKYKGMHMIWATKSHSSPQTIG